MKKNLFRFGLLIVFWTYALSQFSLVNAQSKGLTLTVTPPFVQISIAPGEFWASSLKVVNTNQDDLVIYASPMNFEVQGEEGHGKFLPILQDTSSPSLASWINVSAEPIIIPPESTGEIPFNVRIPENAPPGGHYAAILVGTKPFGSPGEGGSVISVSSFISTLFFVRVAGDVHEDGYIRELSTGKHIYQEPLIDFNLRFENTGNVHLQPKGNIAIYDMWGKEKAVLGVNEQSVFGNVLPKSTRKFNVAWEEEPSIWKAGRYTAIATVGYGKETKQHASRTITFWIIPFQELGILFGGIALFITILWLAIRAYIKRTLKTVMREGGHAMPQPNKQLTNTSPTRNNPQSYQTKHLPHAIDLRKKKPNDST